ncbi:hypothetical protein ZORO111903_09520 [Zobellia roscoffensis]
MNTAFFTDFITRRSGDRAPLSLQGLKPVKTAVCVLTSRFFIPSISALLQSVHETVHTFTMKPNFTEPKIYTAGIDID